MHGSDDLVNADGVASIKQLTTIFQVVTTVSRAYEDFDGVSVSSVTDEQEAIQDATDVSLEVYGIRPEQPLFGNYRTAIVWIVMARLYERAGEGETDSRIQELNEASEDASDRAHAVILTFNNVI